MKCLNLARWPAIAVALAIGGCSSGSPDAIDSTTAAAKKAPPPAPVQIPLPAKSIPKFVNDLPLAVLNANAPAAYAGGIHTVVAGTDAVTLHMCEFESNVLPPGTPLAVGASGATWTWGYSLEDCATARQAVRDSYIGPVIVATRGAPTEMKYVNDLGDTNDTRVLAWKYGTDQTLHWADPDNDGRNDCMAEGMTAPMGTLAAGACATNYSGAIPAVAHLHGGEVPSSVDGGPEAWFTSDGKHVGATFYSKEWNGAPQNFATFRYPNSQEPAPLWFHDHTLGATRLNVYAGLAGAYLLTDAATADPTLPGPAETIPLVIQDRMFDTNGQLMFQAGMAGGTLWALNPEHPFWSPEFVGDTIVVNGKAWPNLKLEPRRYRMLLLNGSNARTYELFLVNAANGKAGPKFWVIATDGGFLDTPVAATKLVMMPGERYEAIVDFAGTGGTKFVMKNTAKTPYPDGDVPDGANLGQILQFTVGSCPSDRCGSGDSSFDPAAAGAKVRSAAMVRLVNAATGGVAAGVAPTVVRQLTLNEVMGMGSAPLTTDVYSPYFAGTGPLAVTYPGGPLEILLNNSKWDAETTEKPAERATEIWEIVNLTADAHPIHLHLVQFQILNRQAFDVAKYSAAYAASFPSGMYEPGMGPPLAYDNASSKAVPGYAGATIPFVGGDPDVTPFLRTAPRPPAAYESGWKDTAQAPPGTVTRLVVRWAPTSLPVGATELAYPFDPGDGPGYVWHCHIIDHEDNEMMRRTQVQGAGGARTFVRGTDF